MLEWRTHHMMAFALTVALISSIASAETPAGYDCSVGKALKGANTKTALNQSYQSCADRCTADNKCESFDYGVRYNGICYLSTASVSEGTGEVVPNPRFNYCDKQKGILRPKPPQRLALHGYKCTPGMALSGENNDGTISGTTIEGCSAACDADEDPPICKSFDYNTNGFCYLSHSVAGKLIPAPAFTYCEVGVPTTPSVPPTPGIPPAPGVPPSPPVVPPATSSSPEKQTIECWNTRQSKWSTMELSCVSGSGQTGRGICANPKTLTLIDQWFKAREEPPRAKLDCWGRHFPHTPSGARRTCHGGKPETDGRTRCEYLRDHYWQQSAPGLGTLENFVNDNLQ